MNLKTLLIMTILMALVLVGQRAAAEEAESYAVMAYAVPSERSLVSMHVTKDKMDYRTEASLFSSPSSSVGTTEKGIIVEWRERVFAALAENMTPDVTDGERMVARIAMRESVKLALEHLPRLEHLIRVLKLEVSTDMLDREKEEDEGGEEIVIPATPAHPQAVHRAVKDRFFMRTGLRIPIEKGRPALLSETSAVYRNVTSYFKVRLDGKFQSTLGLRYTLRPDMQVLVERTTADAVEPATGATVRRTASNVIKLMCVF
jgi:hypothetical protein